MLLSFHVLSQGVAGPDRIICSAGSARLGPVTPCVGCCYQWSPSTGLDDPTKANPIASGLSTTQNYSVTVSMPNGDYVEDDVQVTVYESFLSIYEPEYVGPDMMIPEEMKKIPGAQTFVNLDNDDCDAHFDYQDTEVTGGDNELVKIRFGYTIQLPQRPARDSTAIGNRLIVYQAVLALAQGTSISGVRLWKSNDKSAGEYFAGQPIDLDPVGFNTYEVFLWAEGLEGHTQQQQVKFTTYAVGDISPVCRQDYVSLTVVGIKKMEWIGNQNGYTAENRGKNNKSDVLDADPNNKTPTHVQRVFPEAKQLGSSILSNRPSLYIEFTAPLSSPLTLHLKPFDIDDPSTEITFVDPNDNPAVLGGGGSQPYAGEAGLTYTKDDDNRGLPILPSGSALTAEKSGTFSFPKTIGTTYFSTVIPIGASTSLDFITSIHPGDNYRVAVTNDPLFLTNLRNLDQYDQSNIVDKCTSPTSDIGCLPIETSLMSPILTVWRTLHVEYDKMKNPTWEENLMVKGYFSDFVGVGSSITKLLGFYKIRPSDEYTPAFFDANMPLKDRSTVPPGRFARGSIRIVDQIFVEPQAETEDGSTGIATRITNNGDDNVSLSKETDITLNSAGEKFLTGILRKPGLPDLNILIEDIIKTYSSPPTFEVNLVNPIPNLSIYGSSSLSIKGAPFSEVNSITVNNNSQFEINPTADGNSNLHIPIEVRDDDAIDVYGTSNIITNIDFTLAQTIYKSVYIDVVPDGGGNISYNDGEQIFERNLVLINADLIADPYSSESLQSYIGDGPASVLKSQSNVTNLKYFWNIYLLSAWQAGTDSDADTWEDKNRIRGQAGPNTKIDHCNISQGGRACVIYHEVCRETEKDIIRSIPKTVAHEIGHLFGLTHGAAGDKEIIIPPCLVGIVKNTNDVGIMTASKFNSPSTEFIPYHINLIRSRSKTPGRPE